LPEAEHNAQLRRAVVASTVGTAIEWYDFFLYGTAAGLIFGKLSFPNENPLSATLLAFGTYFIGFIGRPIGAAIFGHYGDRIGRKATLIATLLCMGLATFAIAFVPTYASIGIWGAILLTVLRVFQGIGVGGEWGGSVLLAMEWSRTQNQRGLIASWPQFGVPCGLLLSNLAILAFSRWAGDDFVTWGWRVPFALSIVLVGIGLWIRLGIFETPVFQEILDKEKIEKAPVVEVIKKQPKEIISAAGVRAGAVLRLYRLHLRLRGRYPAYVAGLDPRGRDGGGVRVVLHHPACRPFLRSDRPQKNVLDRRRRHGPVRVRVFRDGRYRGPGARLHRHRAVAHPPTICNMGRRRR
jgi:MFS family permease